MFTSSKADDIEDGARRQFVDAHHENLLGVKNRVARHGVGEVKDKYDLNVVFLVRLELGIKRQHTRLQIERYHNNYL